MNVLYYYAIGFILIWILALLLRNRFDITIEGIVIMLKTDKLRDVIDKIANISPKFWKWSMNLGIPIGIFFMILMAILLIYSLELMFEMPTVSLILPGVDIPGSPLYIPLVSGFISLITVLVVHEFGHGILARCEGVSIKSVGLILAAVIPGAFVEPDEEEVQKVNGISKIRIYGAGPLFNIGLCIVSIILATLIGGFIVSEEFYTTDGVEIISVVPGSPSEGVLSEGMVIHDINGHEVTNISTYATSIKDVKIGDTLNITTDSGTYLITTSSSPNNSSKSYMGIRAQGNVVVTNQTQAKYGTFIPWLLSELEEIFRLMFLLNFSVGTFNLLPMKPLDGGLIFEELLKYRIRDDRRIEFNRTLNNYTRFLPDNIQYWLSRRLNTILNFLSKHTISDEKINQIMRIISSLFITILVILILYGTIPGILKMF